MLVHAVERAVLRDELPRRLVADAGNARDVVRRVALEPDEVGDLIGPDAVSGLDALRRVHLDVADAARRHHQADVRRDELERVAIRRDDARAHPGLVRARGKRGDDVIGLPALELEVAISERLDDRPEERELLAQQVGHRPPPFLVDDVCRLRDGGAVDRARIPGDGDALRLVVAQELEQHVREPEQRIRRKALGRRELLGQGEVRAVGEVVAVDEEELALARRAVVELQLEARERLRRHDPSLRSAGAPDPATRRHEARHRGGAGRRDRASPAAARPGGGGRRRCGARRAQVPARR